MKSYEALLYTLSNSASQKQRRRLDAVDRSEAGLEGGEQMFLLEVVHNLVSDDLVEHLRKVREIGDRTSVRG